MSQTRVGTPADRPEPTPPHAAAEPAAASARDVSEPVSAPADGTAVPTPGRDVATLADDAVALVRDWVAEGARSRPSRDERRLAGVLSDPDGLEFTLGFVDRVMRPEDLRVAARELRRVARRTPRFLPVHLRLAVALGAAVAPVLPWIVIPAARRVLRHLVSHLVIDARPDRLGRTLERLRTDGVQLNLNLLGEAVLGEAEADRRLAGTRELLAREDVDYVSVKVSSIASNLSMWGFDGTVARVVDRLRPLYLDALRAPGGAKFVNLDMEEYRDLDLTTAVFRALLDEPELRGLEAGIVIQAYLPDAARALDELTAWAQRRRAAGGAGIKVRIVKGANLAMERVDAALHGWPQAPFTTKRGTDTNYLRLLDAALTPERTAAVRLGVAGHNLFDIAATTLLARERGVLDAIDVEMLLGMATGQQRAVRASIGSLLLYTPVVHPAEFDAAVSYLVRRLEENASSENFMSAVFDLDSSPAFAREEQRFRASVAALATDAAPTPNRRQDRTAAALPDRADRFENEPDTDPALAANRAWGADLLDRSAASDLGTATAAAARVADVATLEQRVADAAEAGVMWGRTPAAERADALEAIADVLAVMRGRLVEVMAAETGKTIAEADPEVSEAIDFARYYAARARELDLVPGAAFVPTAVTVAAPPWNFPVSIPAGSVLGPLAAGSAVLFKPAPQAIRCGAVLAEAFAEAGLPEHLVTLVDLDESDLGRRLIAHPTVGRVVLTGAWDTAALFRSFRPELDLHAETSGKNAIVVTPSADMDLAVADVVKSAFSNAGQKCSAASLVILVGSVARSERFTRQLVDATTSLRVGWPDDPQTQVGPLVEPAAGRLLAGLTELGPGERWLVEPRRLDDTGRLWSPGIRAGVRPGGEAHLTEYFGPVLAIMHARTLDEALRLQNAVPYGLTAGLHSLDPAEVARWVDGVRAGNLYVNRGTTGAIVERQPFGGWKRSNVGGGAKAGGPNHLITLGGWAPQPTPPGRDLRLDGVEARVRRVIEAAEPGMDPDGIDLVRSAALNDAEAWLGEFGHARDVAQLGVERNVLRYRPTEVVLRLAEEAPLVDLVRMLAAAALVGAPVRVSAALRLPAALLDLFGSDPEQNVREVIVEPDALFASRMASARSAGRIRLIGGDAGALARALDGDPDVSIHAGPVTSAGRVELLVLLREQSISLTAHRFGDPDHAMLALKL